MDLKENASEKKKARRDYSLVWEARPGDPRNVGETKWRVQVEVAGDRAVSIRQMWKLPESFQRGREQENAISIAVVVARILVSAGLVVFGLWLLLDAIRDGSGAVARGDPPGTARGTTVTGGGAAHDPPDGTQLRYGAYRSALSKR